MDPVHHKVEGTRDLEILEWPSGAMEFRRSIDNPHNQGIIFECFVVSAAQREAFMKTLKEVDDART